MSGTTSVPAPTFTAAGFAAPSEQAILTGVTADINAALGGAANPALNTPQGQLAVSETAIIGDCFDQFLALANGVDPAFASGRMQDAIGRIYFISRIPATATTVACTCAGIDGTIIPAGTLVQDTSGNLYAAINAGTIPASGSVVIEFACTATGPVTVPANSVSIYQTISGWNSVTNAQGIPGTLAETRQAFEQRRAATVAGNSLGANGALLGALYTVPGVTSAYVVDNPSSSAATIGGVSLKANSVYAVVNGGASAAIAAAMITKKVPGCSYNGSTTVAVQDPNPLYTNPPTYSVSFDYATAVPVNVNVIITNSAAIPATALMSIQAAVIAAFTGTDGGPSYGIGSTVYASRFYAGIAALGAWAQIVEITVQTLTAPVGFTVPVNINQEPTITATNITVTFR